VYAARRVHGDAGPRLRLFPAPALAHNGGMIDVHELCFDYPGVRALDRVSFQVEAGSITALVGPNGAGKTTLMRCLCGLETPLAGSIVVDGIDVVAEPRRSHERLGYLSDFFGLYDDLTVHQCLAHAAAASGRHAGDEAQARVRDTAARLGLVERLAQRAGALSRGLRQRVAIAQAIIHSPRVLVLDEPAAGLDPEARHSLAALFRALQADGMTLLVSSHILSELEQYATHMLVLGGGRLLEHRALGGRGGRAFALGYLGARAPLEALLAARPEVTASAWREGELVFEFAGDEHAQARLLRELVDAGVEVLRFGPAASDLQQRYLATVAREPAP
jgi:ABC-2 type transport system ATP-binding protein